MKKKIIFIFLLLFFSINHSYGLNFSSNLEEYFFQVFEQTNYNWNQTVNYENPSSKVEILENNNGYQKYKNDIYYKNNKKFLENNLKDKEKLKKELNSVLKKIENDPNYINLENSKYSKYIKIENQINEADFIYILGIPIDKFLLKKNNNGEIYLIITKDPKFIFKNNEDLKNQESLEIKIKDDIQTILSESTIENMKDQISFFNDKYKRNYGPLFKFEKLENFIENIEIKLAYRDNIFQQNYLLGDGKNFLNSIDYIPERLKNLEENSKEFIYFYIPIKNNEYIQSLLRGLTNAESIYKNSNEFCMSIEYDENFFSFSDLICGFSGYFKNNNIKVKTIDVQYQNNWIVILDKLDWKSVVISLLILIGFGVIPFFIFPIIEKVLNFKNKFEREIL